MVRTVFENSRKILISASSRVAHDTEQGIKGSNAMTPAKQPPLDSYVVNSGPLTEPDRLSILSQLWGIRVTEKEIPYYDLYFSHYEHHCSTIPEYLWFLKHIDMVEAAELILQNSRESCSTHLLSKIPVNTVNKEMVINEWFRIVGVALLFLDLMPWKPEQTLAVYFKSTIAIKSTQDDAFRLPRSFNARSIAQVAGINVQWTKLLTSHLEVTPDDRDVAVFHCISVIDLFEQSKHSDIFPDGFLAEIRRTISLLMPVSDKATRKWFESERDRFELDRLAAACPYLKASERYIQKFHYWRDRLIILKEVFDEHQPRGLLQFWRDDRKPIQWWTFWIAVTVFILTLVGCVEGALQVWKAYHPSNAISTCT